MTLQLCGARSIAELMNAGPFQEHGRQRVPATSRCGAGHSDRHRGRSDPHRWPRTRASNTLLSTSSIGAPSESVCAPIRTSAPRYVW